MAVVATRYEHIVLAEDGAPTIWGTTMKSDPEADAALAVPGGLGS